MISILKRYEYLIPFAVLLFSSLIIGLSFIFESQAVLIIISISAILPAILYLLFFRKKYLFPLLVFLIPLSVSFNIGGGTMADFPAEPFIGLFIAVLLVYWTLQQGFNKSILIHPVSILIFLELAWMIICSVNGDLSVVSYKRCLVRFSFITVFYILFSQWMERPRSGINLFIIYAAACIIPILHGFIFHAHFNFNYIASYLMPRPFFTEHTIYGACLAFLIPMLILVLLNANEFGIKGWNFIFLFSATLIVSAGEFLSFSRAAWVSLGVAFILRLLIYVRVKLWMILVILSIGGFAVYKNSNSILELIKRNESVSNRGNISDHLMSVTNLQSDASNLERINRWKCAIRMVKARPLTGFGPGTYQFEYGKFQSRTDMTRISTFRGTNGHAHSELFNALSEEGIPGGIIYLLIMFSVLGYGLRVIYHSISKQERTIALGALLGLITFYVHGFFNAFLDTDKMAVLVFGSISILVYLDIHQRKLQQLKKADA